MQRDKIANMMTKLILIALISLFCHNLVYGAFPQPTDVDNYTILGNYSPLPSVGSTFNTSGGTVTVANLNATSQNPHWKAFVGNITGGLALGDNSTNAIYKWDVVTITGELYATRTSSLINWDLIQCADYDNISIEEIGLNISTTDIDSINLTFNKKSHNSFYAGVTSISQNSCYSTATYINSSSQSSEFQEVLLHDTEYLVYTVLLENQTYGFNNETYDYQIILPENALQSYTSSIGYYFYIELI